MKQERSAGAVVFIKETEPIYLLLQYEAKHWDFPKGNIEKGETDQETVKREIAEETGIKDIEIIKDFKEKETNSWDPQATICSAGEANLLMPQLGKASDTRIVAHRVVAHDDPRDSRDRERDQAA